MTTASPAVRRRAPRALAGAVHPVLSSLLPGLLVVGLMLVWAVHDGGYDAETWYWGALVVLALLAVTVVALGGRLRLGRGGALTLALFAAYVAWCFLSITWARSPGDALQGANQALLYLLIFSIMLIVPWTARGAVAALLIYVLGVGVIAVVLLLRMTSGDHVSALFFEGRLAAPTGYFNSTAALFTMEALMAVGLATRRALPGLLRGLLLAFACAGLQLALIVESRGWLFTLPLVALVAIFALRDRLRVAAAAVLPVAGALVVVHQLLAVYNASGTASLSTAATRAGRPALLACFGVFVLGTLLCWADSLGPGRALSPVRRRVVGAVVSGLAVLAIAAGGTYVTHGHPFRFIARQWNGFSHQQTSSVTGSHFVVVGSGRYDFWRVSLDAFLAHPILGLGEDNFGDFYLRHRKTEEEPSSTHSIEFRLLAQTGIVGFLLFSAFLVGALSLAIKARRGVDPLTGAIAGIAMLPLTVWLIHGSVDWFWEMPALCGPALGFLGMAGALHRVRAQAGVAPASRERSAGARTVPAVLAGVGVLIAAVAVLGIPYLSVREVSLGVNAGTANPRAALRDFARAAELNPLSAVPGRLAGVVALRTGQYRVALGRFEESIEREPDGWFAWLGAGLAASGLGHPVAASRYFKVAYAINSKQPAVRLALSRALTDHPLAPQAAFSLLVVLR